MTHLMDLSPCSYLDEDGSFGLVSVGWLSKECAFAHGRVPPKIRARLIALVDDAYCPIGFLGSHLCDFCAPANEDPHSHRYPHGSANLVIPGPDVIYACPSLIVHYIDVHGYQPPDAFLSAVTRCPPIASEMYFRRLLEINDAGWRSQVEAEAAWMSGRDYDDSELPSQRGYAEQMRSRAHSAQRALQRQSLGGRLFRWFIGTRW